MYIFRGVYADGMERYRLCYSYPLWEWKFPLEDVWFMTGLNQIVSRME